jgi:SAM-dependent methyltransferase
MSKFNPQFYSEFRPFYPSETFVELRAELLNQGFSEPFQIADLGCGTGHSAASLLKTPLRAEIIGVDPDSDMLAEAQRLSTRLELKSVQFQVGSGEATNLPDGRFDAIMMGSSFHWMNPAKTRDEVLRILKSRGLLWIFEYQFPKALALPELNEWIRRQFNLYWKAPGQKPRGSLKEITHLFHEDPRFAFISDRRPPMEQTLSVDELAGMIFSQSRVLCYEEPLTSDEKSRFREETRRELKARMTSGSARLQFNLQVLGWAKRV